MAAAPQFVFVIEGLEGVMEQAQIEPKIELALMRALNASANWGRTRMSEEIRKQVNFGARYLTSGDNARLRVRQRASRSKLEAIIHGRDRPTSLARFTNDKVLAGGKRRRARGGKVGVRVRVKAGSAGKIIERAFLMRLRNNNLGLAVRTDGSKPTGAYKPKAIGKNLWLLYGPSVDQVLWSVRRQDGVIREVEPRIVEYMEKEFWRLMDVEFD